VTGWGRPLLDVLAKAVGVPAVEPELWIRYEDGTEERLEGRDRAKWGQLKGLEPGDVVRVVGTAIPRSRYIVDTFSHAGRGDGEARPLPENEQRHKRLGDLVLPQLLQTIFKKLWDKRYPNYAWDRDT